MGSGRLEVYAGGRRRRHRRRHRRQRAARHVLVRAHFDEPAHRAAEFPAVRPLAIEVVRRGRGRGQQLHAMIVQDVDEPSEAPRAVAIVGRHLRNARQEQHREAARELEIVALRARAVAERREVEPDGAARAPAGDERPAFDDELRVLVRPGAHRLERRRQRGVGVRSRAARARSAPASSVRSR